MRRTQLSPLFLVSLSLLLWSAALAAQSPVDFQPDPKSVQRHGPAYRYPQAGWIVLHIEGEPYERGYQHGRLLAPEIAGYLRCFAALQSPKAPAEGWKITRNLANAVFLRRYHKEFLEEMKGIADGAAAGGAKFDGRAIDLVDVVALNSWAEIETLESALEATPTGLEGIRFPKREPKAPTAPKPMHCSAFAATGPATADGKIVFGHITMFDLYPSLFYNVWIDLKPAKGHRVLMQSYPGGIQSGMDYYFNDAGLLVCETTINQTKFDVQGTSVSSRIRQVLQYASSIDKAVEILRSANNGLYSNEWLLADIKTNEIAMFELGTQKSRLWRSSKDEWFGNTPGFYWGCNNAKDLEVRLETLPGLGERPANLVWRPSDRDQAWLKLYAKHRGKIDAGFGREAFSTPPLASRLAIDAKFTTTDLAKQLKSWAVFGNPPGHTWQPTQDERGQFPEIRPLVANPWTILHTTPPPEARPDGLRVVDLPDKIDSDEAGKSDRSFTTLLRGSSETATVAAWHGTLLPKTPGDAWLAAAFADYEKIVAQEKSLLKQAKDGQLTSAEREKLALELFANRSKYLAAARVKADVPLNAIRSDVNRDDWYRIASGKGVLLLHELRRRMGEQEFEAAMDLFGREHAGKATTAAEFESSLANRAERKNPALHGFFEFWLNRTGLPRLQLGKVRLENRNGQYRVGAELIQKEVPVRSIVDITVETQAGEVTRSFPIGPAIDPVKDEFVIETKERPVRLVVDKYGQTAKANGGVFSVLSFLAEPDRALIVYGTGEEALANREAAQALQVAIRDRWSNFTVPIKSDREVSDGELSARHLLLVGRPDCNSLVERFRSALPVSFGSRSFGIGRECWAHAGSAVIAAGENPLNQRYSLVVLAGLSTEASVAAAPVWMRKDQSAAEVLVLPHGGKARPLLAPARELVYLFSEK